TTAPRAAVATASRVSSTRCSENPSPESARISVVSSSAIRTCAKSVPGSRSRAQAVARSLCVWCASRSQSAGQSRTSRVRASQRTSAVSNCLPEQLLDERRIRFAAARLHHLTLEELQRVFFPVANLFNRLGVGGDHFVYEALHLARIGN